jgi:taurine---2-oxoglutarate transaminase
MAANYPFLFTWTAQKDAAPLHMTGGEGTWFTTPGGRWLDLGALSYQANIGHGHPRMAAALKRQIDSLCLATPSAIFDTKTQLAQELLDMAPPGFTKVFFTLGGSEAVENALKMARLATGRFKAISRYRSYHGATMGALTLTGDYRRAPLEPGLPGVVHALDCHCDHCPFGKSPDTCDTECARHIGQLLQLEGAGTVAAVILESIVGANGVLVPPDTYWPLVREACDRDGALLVADEVLTGFGRTGRWLCVEHYGVVPDMITLAKGLTGGYAPLGAVLVHERVASHFDDSFLYAGLTNYAHPLGCAAGLEAMHIYRDEGLVENAASLETTLMAGLGRLPNATTVPRGKGLLGAVELDLTAEQWARFKAELAARRVFVHTYPSRETLIVSPPLCITERELTDGLVLVRDALEAAA